MDLRPMTALGFVLGATCVMLLSVYLAERIFASRSIHADLASNNPARRLLRVGQVLGISILATSAVRASALGAEGEGFLSDVVWVAAYGGVSLVLAAITWNAGIRLLLKRGMLVEIERGNQAAGNAGAAHWIASALVASRAISGRGLADLGRSLVFFVIAQIALLVLVSLFRALTIYDDAEQIRGDNRAAALSYSGALIAIALLVAQAVDGDFTGWSSSISGFLRALVIALLLYPIRQVIVQMLLLGAPFTFRGGALDTAIMVKRDTQIAALEAVAYLATAFSVMRLA